MKRLFILSTILFIFIGCGGGNTDTVAREPSSINNLNDTEQELKAKVPIRINEILASNKKSIKDPKFSKYSDYIELYNPNDMEIDISGFGLSDKKEKIWKIPTQTKIEAKSYLIIWADDKNSGLHTDFKLSSHGEVLKLYNKDKQVIDTFLFKQQYADIAITRDNDTIVFVKPTPNQENNIALNHIDNPTDTVNTPSSDIYINEFLVRNIDLETNMDTRFYQFSSWIELYNRSDNDIDISHYKLSDEKTKKVWSIPTGTILKAKSYKIIWADKQNIALHASFSLSSKDNAILLYDDNHVLIDKVNYKKQKKNISYGRNNSLTAWGYMLPTFNKKNRQVLQNPKRSKKPKFNLSKDKRTVSITTKDNATIYYTTDGSKPTKSSSLYSKHLKIHKTTVVKAIAYKDNFLPSKIETETYFRGTKDINLPIVSLSMNNKYLYDDTIGIYVDGTNGKTSYGCYTHKDDAPSNFNQDWKRPVFIEYFEKDGSKAFDLGANIYISGQCSRYHKKKPFNFKMDEKYGDKSLKYAFYPDKPNIKKVKSFKLRAGKSSYRVEDVLAAALAKDGNFDVEYQSYKTIQMFMNGKYWGIYTVREKKGKDFLRTNHPEIGKNKIDVIAHTFHGDVIKKGTKKAFDKLDNYVSSHDLSLSKNYKKIRTMIDEENFIDYMVFMIYSANHDWLNNNTRCWREKKDGAKWRWMLDDLDGAFLNPSYDTVSFAKSSYTFLTRLFNNLLKNSTFKQKLKKRFEQHLSTTFTEKNVLKIIKKVVDERKKYLKFEREAWNIDLHVFHEDEEAFKAFAKQRVSIIHNQLDAL